ncbi:MAG: hypothetical protein A3A24_03225 [Candidatus Buchananbacteria bacterium RIFCSPLOWO2_01_FULL_46_12]|uniref:Uncharacterized protein n=1 Tax=Candidatus Buchananbacteria bacterium RIFCSPLOWO2_01_FULL_46_12 TaxID=1797546 RepID=A0A1G1YQT9_9BACT|nr:MAG: hypothetical protein A3A24_03225 [Candidatus Buchananbacteria bacterium RIFCSPLOWO2_01_FULL_46_12]
MRAKADDTRLILNSKSEIIISKSPPLAGSSIFHQIRDLGKIGTNSNDQNLNYQNVLNFEH